MDDCMETSDFYIKTVVGVVVNDWLMIGISVVNVWECQVDAVANVSIQDSILSHSFSGLSVAK